MLFERKVLFYTKQARSSCPTDASLLSHDLEAIKSYTNTTYLKSNTVIKKQVKTKKTRTSLLCNNLKQIPTSFTLNVQVDFIKAVNSSNVKLDRESLIKLSGIPYRTPWEKLGATPPIEIQNFQHF